MALSTRMRLGPYEILSSLGAGGMGELYRARDTRLGRDVAIKIVAPQCAADADRLERFDREARLASALNHANIVTIHDIGVSEAGCYIAMELVDGVGLRAVLRRAPLTVRETLDIAVQVADGLATAHRAGIVHRDLKPDNVMVRRDGCVKILDFGIAKLARSSDGAPGDDMTTVAVTRPGVAVGTLGYMSPEQLTGHEVDFRTDQFAFGVMLYEMVTGRKPFPGTTLSQVLLAIVTDEPEDVASLNPKVPAPLRWVIQRCLSKDPKQRYAATEDLAGDLRMLRDNLAEAHASPAPGTIRRSRRVWATAGLALAMLIAGLGVGRLLPVAASFPSFHPLTFTRGDVAAARFAPDGRTVVYTISAGGLPSEVYAAPVDGVGFRPLGLADSQLLAVSRSGELAVALGWRWNSPYTGRGTLARLPLEGGAARPVADNIALADWTADGKELAVVRSPGRGTTLEFPIGKTLYRMGYDNGIFEMRVSPRGDRIGIVTIDAPNSKFRVCAVDLAGHADVLSDGWSLVRGLAWTPDAREMWFAASKSGSARVDTLYAVTPGGRQRVVGRFPGSIAIDDVSADGLALLTQAKVRREMTGLLAGERTEHDLTWLDYSFPVSLSNDGRSLLFVEGGVGSSPTPSLWLRTAGDQPPVRLGEGDLGSALSPDGRWVAALRTDAARNDLRLIPTGTGEDRAIPLHGINPIWALWLPDGRRLIVDGHETGRPVRTYVVGLHGELPRPLTPEGRVGDLLSPDGHWLLGTFDELPILYPVDSGEPRRPGLPGHEAALRDATRSAYPLAWGDNDHTIFIGKATIPAQILRLDLQTGQTTPWKEIAISDAAGVRRVDPQLVAPGGRAYVATFRRELSDLYLVDGLR